MERTLVKPDHTFETKRKDHLKKNSTISWQLSFLYYAVHIVQKLFLQSSNVFFKVNGTDVEHLHNSISISNDVIVKTCFIKAINEFPCCLTLQINIKGHPQVIRKFKRKCYFHEDLARNKQFQQKKWLIRVKKVWEKNLDDLL